MFSFLSLTIIVPQDARVPTSINTKQLNKSLEYTTPSKEPIKMFISK